MGLWQTILISAGLSLDVFAYCLYKGAMISEINPAEFTKMVGLFTAFQTGMMLVGSIFTRIPVIYESYSRASRLWLFIAALVFLGLGIYMILKSLRKKYKHILEKKEDSYNYRVIGFWAFLASVDALIAGVGFGFLGLRLLGMIIVIAVSSILAAVIGMLSGYHLGCASMNRFVTVGGCLVLIGAVDILAHYMMGF